MKNPKFEVVVIGYDDDPPEWLNDEDRKLCNKYKGDRSFIIMKIGDKIFVESDGGEPEDQTLGRDWAFVEDWLLEAYKAGKRDGSKL